MNEQVRSTEKYNTVSFLLYTAALLTFQAKVTHAAAIMFPLQRRQGLLNTLVVGWQHLLYII